MEEHTRQADWLLRLVGVFSLLLTGATWRLWLPQQAFPQVPLFSWACSLGPLFDWAALAAIVLASAGLLLRPESQWGRWWCELLWVGYGAAVMLDQHRLQPWAYQFLLLALLLAGVRSAWSIRYCRWLTVSIYAHSAWSKLDWSFLRDGDLGQQFVATLFRVAGFPRPSPEVLAVGSWCIVIGEFLVAVLLLIPSTRRPGVVLALALHFTLLLILGPLGMNHSAGVLLWNVCFMVMIPLLFWPRDSVPSEEYSAKTPTAAVGGMVVAMAVGWPLLEPLTWCDNWLAWSLYSPRAERAILLIDRAAAEKLAADLRPFLRETPRPEALRLRIDLWSLESLGVPIYPENRFRIGVARALCERYQLGEEVELIVEGPAHRLSAERQRHRLQGAEAIAAAGEACWFNTRPRKK